MKKSALNTILYLAKFTDESCTFNGENMPVIEAICRIYYKDNSHIYSYMVYLTNGIIVDEVNN